MLNIVKKYISFDHPAHKHMVAKVEKCKSFDDLVALFKDEKWIMTAEIANKIKSELK